MAFPRVFSFWKSVTYVTTLHIGISFFLQLVLNVCQSLGIRWVEGKANYLPLIY